MLQRYLFNLRLEEYIKMFTFPYDTTVCKDHLISNVIKPLKTAEAVEGLFTDFQSQFKDAFSEFN